MAKLKAVELKKFRIEYHVTQVDMALMCDVSLSSFRLWERGVQKPNEGNMTKLNAAIDKLRKKAKK